MLKLIKTLVWLVCIICSVVSGLYADGLSFKGDELDEHSITIFLDKPVDSSTTKYTLNETQRKAVFDHIGVRLESVELYSLRDAQSTCTCELLNIGIVYKNRIVIPMNYIGNDVYNRVHYSEKPLENLSIGTPKSNVYKYLFLVTGVFGLYFITFKVRKFILNKS